MDRNLVNLLLGHLLACPLPLLDYEFLLPSDGRLNQPLGHTLHQCNENSTLILAHSLEQSLLDRLIEISFFLEQIHTA